jgi:hypothetical protein
MTGAAFRHGFAGIMVGAVFFAPFSTRAAIINLSCDNGGMLLTLDTNQKTITDDQPLTGDVVVSDLSVLPQGYFWSENHISFTIERDLGLVNGTRNVGGKLRSLPLADRHCIKTKPAAPKF